ncbi:MAG: hypothetical protein ACPG77_13185, partial [Nannocystaceae bacterium]
SLELELLLLASLELELLLLASLELELLLIANFELELPLAVLEVLLLELPLAALEIELPDLENLHLAVLESEVPVLGLGVVPLPHAVQLLEYPLPAIRLLGLEVLAVFFLGPAAPAPEAPLLVQPNSALLASSRGLAMDPAQPEADFCSRIGSLETVRLQLRHLGSFVLLASAPHGGHFRHCLYLHSVWRIFLR